MTDNPTDPTADERGDEVDRKILDHARARRDQRFWHREGRFARQAARAAEKGQLNEAQLMTRHMAGEAKRELLGKDSFVPVFFLAVFIVVFAPLIDGSHIGRTFSLVILVTTLLLALQRSLVHRRNLVRLAWVMGAAIIFTGIAGLLARDGKPIWVIEAFTSASFVLVIVIALPAILIRTLMHPVINLNTLAGVMTAYLFIGLMFTGIFRFTDAVDGDAFFAQKDTVEAGDFEYFSFITITTTGYGDLTPGSQAARTEALAEAVTGQIFLVTVVARVVGLLGQQRNMPRLLPAADGAGGEGPDPDPDTGSDADPDPDPGLSRSPGGDPST